MSETRQQIMNLEILIRSRYPIIYIVSADEKRVMEAITRIGRRLDREVYLWTCLSGLIRQGQSPVASPTYASLDPSLALEQCRVM